MAINSPRWVGRDHGEVDRQRALRDYLGPKFWRSFSSLAKEKNKKIYYPELLNLALRLKKDGKDEIAISLFQELQAQDVVPSVKKRAEEILAAMRGEGPFGLRAEFFLDNFVDQLTDAPSIIGMVAGGLAFRAARLSALGRLFRNPVANTLTQVWGRRLLASTIALGAESVAFTGAIKLTQSALGREVDWSAGSWGSELAGTAILLGNLRLFGWGAGFLGRGLSQRFAFGKFSQGVLEQLGMYTGILSARGLETYTGLRPNLPYGNPWLDSLKTLIHFNAAGLLVRRITPKSLHRWETKLDQQADLLFGKRISKIRSNELGLKNPQARQSTFPIRLHPQKVSTELDLPIPTVLRGIREAQPDKLITRDRSTSWNEVGEPTSRKAKKSWPSEEVVQHFYRQLPDDPAFLVSEIIRGYDRPIAFLLTLSNTRIADPVRLDRSLRRLNHMVSHTQPEGVLGSYSDWVTRVALPQITLRFNAPLLDRLLNALHDGMPLRQYEQLLSEGVPSAKLLPWPKIPLFHLRKLLPPSLRKYDPRSQEVQELIELASDRRYRWVQDLNLSRPARKVLYRWLLTQRKMKGDNPFLLKEADLISRLELEQHEPERMREIERVLLNTAENPLALLRLRRLELALYRNGEYTVPRLRELADPNFQIFGIEFPPGLPSPQAMKNTQWDAYVGQDSSIRLIHELHRRMADLLDPAKLEARKRESDQILTRYLHALSNQKTITPRRAIELLEKTRDPLALQFAKELRQLKIPLETPWNIYEAAAFFFHHGGALGRQIAVQLSPSVREIGRPFDPEFLARAFFKTRDPQAKRTARALFEISRREKAKLVAQTFLEFGDPLSIEIAEAIRGEAFILKMEDHQNYRRTVERAPGTGPNRSTSESVYIGRGNLGPLGVMVVRERPLNLPPFPSRQDIAREVFGNIVHEYQHHLDIDLNPGKVRRDIDFFWELNAHSLMFLWTAEKGEARYLQAFREAGHAGYGRHLRDKFEEWYPRLVGQ